MVPLLLVALMEEAAKVSVWGKSWLNENTGAGSGSLLASLPQLLHPEGPEMNIPVS